ncbi:MAG: sigma-70 family RNA polymerase sigma factor [Terracidiphilus sp.]|jgi:RNA polymerase sigma-70 factor (ECF subfamily)
MFWESALPGELAGGALDKAPAGGVCDPAMENDAFAVFYERSARPLWAYLARVSSDPALADDLMQESYVRYLCASGAPSLIVQGEAAARLYLFRIATNLLRDHWRRPRPASFEEIPEEVFSTPGSSGQTDTQVLLGPALGQLKPRESQLLWLAYAEGYSHREIAEVTGLAAASIRLLLFRARRRLAGLLRTAAAGRES